MKLRFGNCIRDMKTLPGADLDIDHNLLAAEVQTHLKQIRKAGKKKLKFNLKKIKSKENDVKQVIE